MRDSGMEQTAKHVVDAVSVSVTAAALLNWLPAAVAFFTLVWTLIRIYETSTIQKLLAKRRKKKPRR